MKYLRLKQQYNDISAIKDRTEAELKELKMRYLDSLNTIKAMSMDAVATKEANKISEMEVSFLYLS